MAGPALDDVAAGAKEAEYVGAGLGVLTFQRLQVRRNQVSRALRPRTEDVRQTVDVIGEAVVDRLKVLEERLDAVRQRASR